MLGVFANIKDRVPRGDKLSEPHTEGFCNKLHYRASVALLLGKLPPSKIFIFFE